MKRRPLPTNLVRETWNNLNSDELRKLLHERFGYTLGQYASDDAPGCTSRRPDLNRALR